MDNPIRRVREELGLSRGQLCHAARMRVDALHLVENGLVERPQAKLLQFLAQVERDPDEITREYGVYREHLQRQVLTALGDVAPTSKMALRESDSTGQSNNVST